MTRHKNINKLEAVNARKSAAVVRLQVERERMENDLATRKDEIAKLERTVDALQGINSHMQMLRDILEKKHNGLPLQPHEQAFLDSANNVSVMNGMDIIG